MEHKTNPDSNKAHPSDQQGKTNPKSTKSKDNAQSKGNEGLETELVLVRTAEADQPRMPGIGEKHNGKLLDNSLHYMSPEDMLSEKQRANPVYSSRSRPPGNHGVEEVADDANTSKMKLTKSLFLGSPDKIQSPNPELSISKDRALKLMQTVSAFLESNDNLSLLVNTSISKQIAAFRQLETQLAGDIFGADQKPIFQNSPVQDDKGSTAKKEQLRSGGQDPKIKNDTFFETPDDSKKIDKPVSIKGSARGGKELEVFGLFPQLEQQNKPQSTEAFIEEFTCQCIEYLPICLLISYTSLVEQTPQTLLGAFHEFFPQIAAVSTLQRLALNTDFIEEAVRMLLKHHEATVFGLFITKVDDLNIMVTENFFNHFITYNSYDLLLEYYNKYLIKLQTNKISLKIANFMSKMPGFTLKVQSSTHNIGGLSDQQTVLFIKSYFLATDDNNTIMQILKHQHIKEKQTVEMLLETEEEDRIIRILREYAELVAYLDKDTVLQKRLFKLIILFDKNYIINIMNEKLSKDSKTKVYHEICNMIEKGKNVEALCNIVTYVSETFWDIEKLDRFFNSLSKTLNNRSSDWLVYIQNPLLFSINLVYFFSKLKEQLDFKNQEIVNLQKGMLGFCKMYVQNANEETLKLNLADKDNNDLGFLDYAFLLKDMSILETDQIEGLIYQLWDLGRHTMQNVHEFMRIYDLDRHLERFSCKLFVKDLSTPIEDNDSFQLEYRYTSDSVMMKVIADLFWPLVLIIPEFIFSMQIISMRLSNKFDDDWLNEYIREYKGFFIFLVVLRANYIVSCVIKSLLIKSILKEANYMQTFYNVALALNFVEFFIYPVFLWDHFWFLNVTQMLYVLTIVGYFLFNILSLNEYGVILRIFARMSSVVIVFGTVSCVLITIVAYPIHTAFLAFSQPILGQIYTDLNLFDTLYQGILTCFEFVFGAVVLVRPYTEQNNYTYAMTFIMMLFSFFGNIMLANMLVAFLTSQFDEINTNAKYLTMNMQFGLIKVYKKTDYDSMISMPFLFTIPALPFFLFMVKDTNGSRGKVNEVLRKFIHFVNVFIPTLIIMLFYLIFLSLTKFIGGFFTLLFKGLSSPLNILYSFVWLIAGYLLLLKLMFLDFCTICKIVLDFSKKSENRLNNELNEKATNNLVKLFIKLNRVIQYQIQIVGAKEISIGEFLVLLGMFHINDFIAKKVVSGLYPADDPTPRKQSAVLGREGAPSQIFDEMLGLDLNTKYSQDDWKLAPLILKKYAFSSSRNVPLIEKKLDLVFMSEKFANNIRVETIGRLVAFDKSTLDIAREFLQPSAEEEVEKELTAVNEKIDSVDKKVERLKGDVRWMMSLINK
jgi:hypothetical protein